MTGLAAVDAQHLFVDVDSWLGRATAAGMHTGDLPATFGDAMMAWLRARALAWAQQHRRGISLGREPLEQGVARAWICVDEGLRRAAPKCIDDAVARLARRDLDGLYRDGYDALFEELVRLRDGAAAWWADDELLELLPDAVAPLRRWSRVVPEDWSSLAASGGAAADPRQDLRCFADLHRELTFVTSLPRAALRGLRQEEEWVGSLTLLLRRLWLALALGRDELTLDGSAVRTFCEYLRTPTGADAARRALRTHVERVFPQEADRHALLEAAEAQWQRLCDASASVAELDRCLRLDTSD